MDLAEIGRLFHEVRRLSGETLKDNTDMHSSNLSRIERGKKPLVQFKTILRLAERYGYEVVVRQKAVADE